MKNPNRNKNCSEKEIQLFVFSKEINLRVEFDYSIGNNSFDHAFGTQYYPDYIEEVFNIEMFFLNQLPFLAALICLGY